MPRVSIGIPVYNCEKYVGEAIDSVLAQTYRDFELIISDNASTDRTTQICKEYATKDSRIRYYRNEKNLGAAKNFNQTFRLSNGEYFKWLAADDVLEPEFLERCLELLEENQSLILAFSKYKELNEIANCIREINDEHNLDFQSPYQRFSRFLKNWRRGNFAPIWSLIRSDILRKTSLFRNCICLDEVLVLELAVQGKFGQVDEYLIKLRHHKNAWHVTKLYNDWRQGVEEARWIDPNNTGTTYLPYWRRLWEYSLLAVRSDEDLISKLRMLVSLRFLWYKWWRKLGSELIFAVGLGPRYVCLKHAIKQGL